MESSIKHKPVYSRVLIQRTIQEKTAGGIIIPNAKRHANCVGIIVSLGSTAGWVDTYDDEGNPILKRELAEGQKVAFGRHSGAWLDATYNQQGDANDDGTLFICDEKDILTVIKD